MKNIVDLCSDCPEIDVAGGETFITEGGRTGHLYVLTSGVVEVYRDDVSIAIVSDRGTVFGEMSILLDTPHTASVRALEPSRLIVIDDALGYLRANPDVMIPIAQLLAHRLQGATTYLVDLKHQFQHHGDHMNMVDEVLESLTHRQGGGFIPSGDLSGGP